MSVKKLDMLSPGQWAVVYRVENSPIQRRLEQLGFTKGERVCRMYTDRSGFLSAYRIENSLIALRRTDAESVLVQI